MPQPSRTDRRPRHSCSFPRSRTCMVRYPIIFRLSSNPSRANTILPSMATVPWATFELASAKDITPNTKKLPSSISDVRSRVGRLVIKAMAPTTVRITVWTMRKFRSSSKQMASRHLLTVDITRFNKPMASFKVLPGALRLTRRQSPRPVVQTKVFTRLLHFHKVVACQVSDEPVNSRVWS